MAGIFEYIPIIAAALLGVGLVGVIVYERSRTRQSKEPESTA